MLDRSQKALNDRLRRDIWRSLLILKSAAVTELIGVVSGLTVRKARAILRELELHGYVGKNAKKGRPVYFQAVDSPSLPAVCGRCNRPFDSKVCPQKQAKRQRERKTKRQTEAMTPTGPVSPAEVTHDAA